jgi:hypothetical protein
MGGHRAEVDWLGERRKPGEAEVQRRCHPRSNPVRDTEALLLRPDFEMGVKLIAPRCLQMALPEGALESGR